MNRLNRRATLGFLTAAALGLAVSGPAAAEDVLSGSVTIESTSIALGIGVTWGDGVLTYDGKTYNFSVEGLSVVDLGVSSVSAAGEVYNLHKLEDFNGNYVSGQAGGAVGGGAAVSHLENQQGVVIKLHSTQTGVKLTLAAEGVQIKLSE